MDNLMTRTNKFIELFDQILTPSCNLTSIIIITESYN